MGESRLEAVRCSHTGLLKMDSARHSRFAGEEWKSGSPLEAIVGRLVESGASTGVPKAQNHRAGDSLSARSLTGRVRRL